MKFYQPMPRKPAPIEVMKQFIPSFGLLLACALPALGDPSPSYVNNGTLITNIPPQIDATNFINNGDFEIQFGFVTTFQSALLGSISVLQNNNPLEFSDVQFYTNRGIMACDTGFKFDNAPSGAGTRHRSAVFGNANLGNISAGSAFGAFSSIPTLFAGQGPVGTSLATAVPAITVSATNVVNTGLLDVGINGVLSVDGANLNLGRGTLHVEGFDDFASSGAFSVTNNNGIFFGGDLSSFNLGIFDINWGFGIQTNLLSINSVSLPFPFSPTSNVTNANFVPSATSVFVNNALAFVNAFEIGGNISNITIQAVFVNTNVGFSTQVRFADSGADFLVPVIHWESVATNPVTFALVTNDLYLSDFYGSFPTNYLITNSFALSGAPQPSPYNYEFARSYFDYGGLAAAVTPYSPALFTSFNGFPATNDYAAYSVEISSVTAQPDSNLNFSTITNTPGRIIVSADNSLDLTRASLTGANYVNLVSTNHFIGSAGADILAPFLDINVGTTNGSLTISNLVAPYVPRITGTVSAYSARWTNIVNGVTNRFHVLMVDAELQPTIPVQLLSFFARSTNVTINDLLIISNQFVVNASSLTIGSNAAGASVTSGEVDLQSPNIVWSTSFPTLQYFTNFGVVTVPNTTYFEGIRSSPYYPSNFIEPYQAFVNHGSITTSGDIISANYFENTGTGARTTNNGVLSTNLALLSSFNGPVSISANTAVMSNGYVGITGVGDVSIVSGSLAISQHAITSGGALSFTVSNMLSDGGVNSSNFWTAADGFNLFLKPGTGDLLGTTLTATAPANLEVTTVWAGEDRGATVSGFSNDAALGHLILDGGSDTSAFFFGGTNSAAHNAMYVDLLELRDGATNQGISGGQLVFTALDIDPSMTIYFADATANGLDISEKLNGSSGGRAVWVPAYAGFFSGTNITYPSGHVYTFNRGLVLSQDIDSNGNGTVNAFDPFPIFTADNVGLAVTITNLPPLTARVSWHALENSTNFLYYKNGLTSTNWLLLTNFVQGPVNGVVTISDPVQGASRYYKVQIDAVQP